MGIIIAIIITTALILLLIIKIAIKDNKSNTDNNILSPKRTQSAKSTINQDQEYYIGDKCIGLSPRKGYTKFEIAGAHHRNLSMNIIGRFNGYAIAQTDNKYDPYAIAVYNDAGIHLGFLPKNNKKTHDYIIEECGKVHAYGYIACGSSGMYGNVCVETDKTLVTKRNKPYNVE